MVINEFRWGVRPPIPSWWHGTSPYDGFDVEIAADWIEARAGDDGDQEKQKRRAEEVVQAITRSIGLHEKARFTATFGAHSRFDPQSARRDATVFLSEGLGLNLRCHADAVVFSAGGAVVSDTRQERVADMFQRSGAIIRNDVTRRLSEYLLEYHDDPAKKLAPLYDIIELAVNVFGSRAKAATSLNISEKKMSDAARLMNDRGIRRGRHRGREMGPQREPTPQEVRDCEDVAEQIVNEYTRLVQLGRAPR